MGTHPIFESDFDCLTVPFRKWLITSRVMLDGQPLFKKTRARKFLLSFVEERMLAENLGALIASLLNLLSTVNLKSYLKGLFSCMLTLVGVTTGRTRKMTSASTLS